MYSYDSFLIALNRTYVELRLTLHFRRLIYSTPLNRTYVELRQPEKTVTYYYSRFSQSYLCGIKT